ncbi:MAG: hypothetical protein WA705_18530 [Candidatus Ozemobacteraceae bacterium]
MSLGGPLEAELLGEAIVVNPDEFFKIVFDTAIPARLLRIAWSIDGWGAVHFAEESGGAQPVWNLFTDGWAPRLFRKFREK